MARCPANYAYIWVSITLHCSVDYFNSPHPHSTKPFPSSTLPPTQLPAGSENTTIYAASSAAVLVFVVTILVVIACLVKRAHGRQRYDRLPGFRIVVDHWIGFVCWYIITCVSAQYLYGIVTLPEFFRQEKETNSLSALNKQPRENAPTCTCIQM